MTLALAMPNWVGDVVMATPTLRALRARFPKDRLLAVVRPGLRRILEPNPWTDGLIEAGKSAEGLWRAAARLRRERVDTGVLLPNSFRSALLFRMGNVRWRIGYARGGRGFLLTDSVPPEKRDGRIVSSPQITYYLRLAALLGAPTDDRRMELGTTPADEAKAAEAWRALGLEPGRTLLLCPGASYGPSKMWPAEHWGALVRAARAELDLESAILCGPHEADAAAAIQAAAGACASFHGHGIDLASARAVVRHVRAVVAIDSGLRHFAVAFGRPVVTLFGPTEIVRTEIWYDREIRLQGVVPCGPCQEKRCPRGTLECMWKIRPDEVVAALGELIGRTSA